MHFLVIGCGSIGQRYIKILKSLGHRVSGYEKEPRRAKQVEKICNIEIFDNKSQALTRQYDGAFVCTPTNLHISISIELAKRNINLFIEKPISNSLKRIDELSEIVDKKHLVVLVGCNTRFLPNFQLAKKLINQDRIGRVLSVKVECGFYLPYWHPYEDYRKGYSANRHMGGGVILDDIHELDSLYWFFGQVKEVFCFADKISSLDIDTEDIAEIFLKFKSGIIAQIHLDYIQRTYRRYYEFIGEKGIIIWDYIRQSVQLYSKKTNQGQFFQESINTNREIMFINEVKHFINCIAGKDKSINDISFAKNVLRVALACYKSKQKNEVVKL